MKIQETKLWARLGSTYPPVVLAIRKISEVLASKIAEQLPAFTDHSIKHMDALWIIAEAVLTDEQLNSLTEAEAFALGVSFYSHDLGMALASTVDGLAIIRATSEYQTEVHRLRIASSPAIADLLAVRFALRETHAVHALSLLSDVLPGLGRYLIEETEVRDAWAFTIGEIAASHHWSLEKLERSFGLKGVSASPDGNSTIDMAYVACLLRIIDYAHINRERAPALELLLRPKISPDSLIHWKAQARISAVEIMMS